MPPPRTMGEARQLAARASLNPYGLNPGAPGGPTDMNGKLIRRMPPEWGMDDTERQAMFQDNLQRTYDTPIESVVSPVDLLGPPAVKMAGRAAMRAPDLLEDLVAKRGNVLPPDDWLPPLPPPEPQPADWRGINAPINEMRAGSGGYPPVPPDALRRMRTLHDDVDLPPLPPPAPSSPPIPRPAPGAYPFNGVGPNGLPSPPPLNPAPEYVDALDAAGYPVSARLRKIQGWDAALRPSKMIGGSEWDQLIKKKLADQGAPSMPGTSTVPIRRR